MKKIEIYEYKRKKLFKLMFYVPVIVFILIIIVTGLKRDLNEWKEAWFGFAVMICIYIIIEKNI